MVFEGDSAIVIKNLQANTPCMASFGNVIADSIFLASQLESFSFSHVCRMGNVVVDKLAKLAKNFDTSQVWVKDTPSEVHPLELIDCNFVEVGIKFGLGSQKKKNRTNNNCHLRFVVKAL